MSKEHFEAENLIRKSESYDQYYEVLNELGRGRFAVVKKCVCKETQKTYAAKVIKKSRTNSHGRSGREQLLLEIDILNKSTHPKMVRLFDVFETRTEMQLILELAAGGDLHRHCIEGDVVRTEKEVCYLIRQIVEAVLYLHDQSIVHLDLKPDNILLAKQCEIFPEIRLIDFGLSRRLDGPYSQFDIVGTPEYVAPEVLSFEPIDFGSDMWSVGVVTYVLLSGISPFAGDDVMETYANIGQVDYDFDCEEFDEVSDNAIDFIEKLLVRRPKDRMSAREALEHGWIKQLDGGISAEDVLEAQHAQMESPPEDMVVSPLVEEEYPSSSESETPLEKSAEFLTNEKGTVCQENELVEKEENSPSEEAESPSSQEEKENVSTEEHFEEVKSHEKRTNEDNVYIECIENNHKKSHDNKTPTNISDKKTKTVDKPDTDKTSKETVSDNPNESEEALSNIPNNITVSTAVEEENVENPKFEPTNEVQKTIEQEPTQEEIKTNPSSKTDKNDLPPPIATKPTTIKNDLPKQVALVQEPAKPKTVKNEKTADIKDEVDTKNEIAIRKLYKKPISEDSRRSSSPTENETISKSISQSSPEKSPVIMKKNKSADIGTIKVTALEKRKQAFELALKGDAVKGNSKPMSRFERTTSNKSSGSSSRSESPNKPYSHSPRSGSNKSSTSNSPVLVRKEQPVVEPEAKNDDSEKTADVVITDASHVESKHHLVSSKPSSSTTPVQSPKISRQSVRGKIPGGIAAKMADKFSNVSNESPGRSSPKPLVVIKRGGSEKGPQKIEESNDMLDNEAINEEEPSNDFSDGPVSKGYAKISAENASKSPKVAPKISRTASEQMYNNVIITPKGRRSSEPPKSTYYSEPKTDESSKNIQNGQATPAKDIKVNMSLSGSMGPNGKKLRIGQLFSSGSKKENNKEDEKSAVSETNDAVVATPVKINNGSSLKMKFGIGKPNRKKNVDNKENPSKFQVKSNDTDAQKHAPPLKDLRGKSTSLSRRRADSSPNSSRKNYRRLYVTKLRNSKLYDPDFNIMSSEAAKIMQRVDNDVLQVELRLKSTDLKLLP